MLTQAPRGTKDVLPGDSYKWQYVEEVMRKHCANFGYREMRTPVFEHTELFLRGVGDTTDIVQKEMYTFNDKGNRSITLKPEGTAGVVRSFIENGMQNEVQPTKVYYLNNPIFRYENPQSGRLREHHQFGVEAFGGPNASLDAEIIGLALGIFKELGITGLSVNINSIGCPDCRPKYNAALKEYFRENLDNLCDTCKSRYDRNPLRILDCKDENCRKYIANAPIMIDYLCDDCKEHFESLKEHLNALNIEYKINPMIVRGLDYYTKTVFEVISHTIGAQGTVCGGGRYDNLVEELGGPKMPGVGFGLGIERLLLTLESTGLEIEKPSLYDVYVCTMGKEAEIEGFKLCMSLREKGIKVESDHVGRSMKAQFKYADKIDAPYVVVIGEEELKNNIVVLRDMKNGIQQEVAMDKITDQLLAAIKNEV